MSAAAGPCTGRGPTGAGRTSELHYFNLATLKLLLDNNAQQLSPVLSPGMSQKFPEVQGGGSLIVAWQTRDKHVLVVGGGDVGFPRVQNIYQLMMMLTCVN